MDILTLDCGTTRIKAGLFEIPDKSQLAESGAAAPIKAPLRLWVDKSRTPEEEQEGIVTNFDRSTLDVDSYLSRVQDLIKRIVEELAGEGVRIECLCVTACCPALVALDSHMRPLYPALTHLFRGSQVQAKELTEKIGRERWLATAGNLPAPGGISLTALQWLAANRPRVAAEAAHWVHLHALILYSLTGNLVTDPTQASYTGLYDVPNAGGWLDESWLEQFGISREQLPEVRPSDSFAGRLTVEAASVTGLCEGIPVVTGGADVPTALTAAEELLPDSALNMSGTTEIVAASCQGFPTPGGGFLLRPHMAAGRWAVAKISPIGGQTLIWFYDRFCRDMSPGRFWDWVLRLDVEVERMVEDQMVAEEPGEVVEFAPFLFGSRHDLSPLRASFTGLTADTTREDMLCAVLASYRKWLHDASQEVAAVVGRPLYRVVTSGGYDISSLGFHRRAAFNRSSLTPIEAAVLRGAAILAARALEKES
ncbi:hypothetical protein LLH00_03535 [bacterium]|nr:hypothetical protein [bacterium]